MNRRQYDCLRRALACVDAGAGWIEDVVKASDLHYALREPAWQEGPEGMAHCRASARLREAAEQLRQFKLPQGLEGLG